MTANIRPDAIRPYLLALLVGGTGAAMCARLNLPLAWLLGAAVACAGAAMAGWKVQVPGSLRPPVVAIVGVMLGGGFNGDTLTGMVRWLPSLAGLLVVLAAGALLSVLFFRKVGRMDFVTAYFAGMPGGIVEMVLFGERRGGDMRAIALSHASRVLLSVVALPWIILALGGGMVGAGPPSGALADSLTTVQALILIAMAAVGAGTARLCRLPVPDLLGPMLLSGGLHMAGWITFNPPFAVIAAAQVVLGANIGCRFANTAPAYILRMLALSAGSTALLLVVTTVSAFALNALTGIGIFPLVLAYAPGGLPEMSIIALALHVETAFVVTHHIARIFLVLAIAPHAFAIFHHRSTGE